VYDKNVRGVCMATIRVPQQIATISEAVQVAGAGDTIKVSQGIYNEAVNIPIDKDKLRIIGDPCCKPVLVGLCFNEDSAGFTINSNAVCISNFCIKGGYGYGIDIFAKDCTINDCKILKNTFDGIRSSSESTGLLVNGTECLQNGANGILSQGANSCIICCEFCKNVENGITITGYNTIILKCKSHYNLGNGVRITSDLNSIIENKIICNRLSGVKSTGNVNFFYNNIIKNNGNDAIDMENTSINSVVINCMECNGGDAVDIEDGDTNRVIFNKIICNHGNGVVIGDDGTNNFIDDNKFIQNNKAGVLLRMNSVDNAIRDNFFDCNDPNINAYPPANTENVFDGNVKVNTCKC
jgi:parallel beta helix pectate lyase-like protein